MTKEALLEFHVLWRRLDDNVSLADFRIHIRRRVEKLLCSPCGFAVHEIVIGEHCDMGKSFLSPFVSATSTATQQRWAQTAERERGGDPRTHHSGSDNYGALEFRHAYPRLSINCLFGTLIADR